MVLEIDVARYLSACTTCGGHMVVLLKRQDTALQLLIFHEIAKLKLNKKIKTENLVKILSFCGNCYETMEGTNFNSSQCQKLVWYASENSDGKVS